MEHDHRQKWRKKFINQQFCLKSLSIDLTQSMKQIMLEGNDQHLTPDHCRIALLTQSTGINFMLLLVVNHLFFVLRSVQHQIYVIGVEYADFVTYLQKESCIIRIARDPTYKEHSVPLLLNFFNLHVLPELLSHNIRHNYIAKNVVRDLVDKVSQKYEDQQVQEELNLLKLAPSSSTPVKKKIKKN